jgi:hypothetical protein
MTKKRQWIVKQAGQRCRKLKLSMDISGKDAFPNVP